MKNVAFDIISRHLARCIRVSMYAVSEREVTEESGVYVNVYLCVHLLVGKKIESDTS